MFEFIEKVFIGAIGFVRLSSSIAIKCASMNNQQCQHRHAIVDINSN